MGWNPSLPVIAGEKADDTPTINNRQLVFAISRLPGRQTRDPTGPSLPVSPHSPSIAGTVRANLRVDIGFGQSYVASITCGCSSMVECYLPKVDVVGSNPISRFVFPPSVGGSGVSYGLVPDPLPGAQQKRGGNYRIAYQVQYYPSSHLNCVETVTTPVIVQPLRLRNGCGDHDGMNHRIGTETGFHPFIAITDGKTRETNDQRSDQPQTDRQSNVGNNRCCRVPDARTEVQSRSTEEQRDPQR